jgi:hypothetical protein
MFKALDRESERIDGAYMITLGAIQGTKPIIARSSALHLRVTSGPVTPDTLADLSRHADDLWNQHERALAKKRLVS